MFIRFFWPLALFLILLPGCYTLQGVGTLKAPKGPLTPLPNSEELLLVPPIGMKEDARVGDIIFTYTSGAFVPRVKLISPGLSEVPSKNMSNNPADRQNMFKTIFPVGDYFEVYSDDEGNNYYTSPLSAVLIREGGQPKDDYLLTIRNGQIYAAKVRRVLDGKTVKVSSIMLLQINLETGESLERPFDEIDAGYIPDLSYLRWELVFTGFSGDDLRLEYREFSVEPGSELIRSNFSLSLSYNLSEIPATISYRNTDIEILSRAGNSIDYMVKPRDE